jgi:hypothetical protein
MKHIFVHFYFAVRVPTRRRRIKRKPVPDRHWATGFSLFLSQLAVIKHARTHTKRNNLRDRDGEIGTEQFRAFPKAVERRDDGARENVFKYLESIKKNQHLTHLLQVLRCCLSFT